MKPQKSKILIPVDMDSANLVKKLNAIAKHTNALADELKQIEEGICPECGRKLYNDILHSNGEVIAKEVYCSDCGYIEQESL